MFRYALIVLAAAIAAGPARSGDINIPPMRDVPPNLSSHSPEFFRDLLGGRVWVNKNSNAVAANYYSKDGAFTACFRHHTRKRFLRMYPLAKWKIGTPAFRSNLEENWLSPQTGPHHYRMVIIYTPDTGRLHAERYFSKTKQWKIVRDGWVQDSWPAALLEACPKLVLPTHLPIDEYQNTIDWHDVKRNASPIRNHPGSQIFYPGATGLAATKGQPTMTPHQLEGLRKRLHGMIGLHAMGMRLVTVNNPGLRELWMIDPEDNVLDFATVTPIPNRPINVVRWKKLQFARSYRLGYPVPVLPTSRRHPAFQMMIDLAESGQPVPLANPGNAARDHVFKSDGSVQTPPGTGSWWLSRGQLHVQAAGSTQVYPWRDVVALSGWKEQIPRSAD